MTYTQSQTRPRKSAEKKGYIPEEKERKVLPFLDGDVCVSVSAGLVLTSLRERLVCARRQPRSAHHCVNCKNGGFS